MARYNNGRITNLANALGLEDDDYVEDAGEEMSDAEIVEAGNEVDDGIDEVETAADTVEDLADDGETLTNVGEVVDGAIDSGEGLSEDAATVVEETIENILRRHGMKRHKRYAYPSMEDFGSKAGRVRAAKQLKVSIEDFWQSIHDGIIAIIKGIQERFARITQSIFGWERGVSAKVENMLKRLTASGKRLGTLGESKRDPGSASGQTAVTGQASMKYEIPALKNVYGITTMSGDNQTILFEKFIKEGWEPFRDSVQASSSGPIKKLTDVIQSTENAQRTYGNTGEQEWNSDNTFKGQKKYTETEFQAKMGQNSPQSNSIEWIATAAISELDQEYLITSNLCKDTAPKNTEFTIRYMDQLVDSSGANIMGEMMFNMLGEVNKVLRSEPIKALSKYTSGWLGQLIEKVKRFFAKIKNLFKTDTTARGSATGSDRAQYSANTNEGKEEAKEYSQHIKDNMTVLKKYCTANVTIYKNSMNTVVDVCSKILSDSLTSKEINQTVRT